MKKKIDWKIIIITVAVCLLPMIAGIYFYDKLPEQMAVHFNVNNEPDNYASKEFALFGLPLLMTAFQIICCVCCGLKTEKSEKRPKVLGITVWIIPVMTVMLYLMMIMVGLGKEIDIGGIICFILGILLILTGNYTPKMSFESAKKVMHPMPKDEKTFRKEARVIGYTFVIAGIFMVVSLFFNRYITLVVVGMLVVAVLAESVYCSVKWH